MSKRLITLGEIMSETQTATLFNANDSVTGRDGGPYLDIEQARESEIQRAKVEGREPNLDNPPPNAGIQLNTASQQLATASVNNLPSQSSRGGIESPESGWLTTAHEDKDNPLTAVVQVEVPVLKDAVFDAVEAPGGENNSKRAASVRKAAAKKAAARKPAATKKAAAKAPAKKAAVVPVPESK
jgi:hypothetical protein